MRTMRNLLVKKAVVTVLAVGVSLAAVNAFWGGSDSALSQLGSSGSEVRAIQERRDPLQGARVGVDEAGVGNGQFEQEHGRFEPFLGRTD